MFKIFYSHRSWRSHTIENKFWQKYKAGSFYTIHILSAFEYVLCWWKKQECRKSEDSQEDF